MGRDADIKEIIGKTFTEVRGERHGDEMVLSNAEEEYKFLHHPY